jgi:MFS transporter, FHS family, Na+ dependent glucose transporter 1
MPVAVRRSTGYFVLFFCSGLDMAILGPTLPALAGQTGSTVGAMGMVFFLGAGGATLGTLLGGWIFDWAPGRIVLGLAQMVSASLLLLVPHVHPYALLVGLFVVKGLTSGLVNTGANTLLLWTHGGKAGPYVNALHFFWGLGSFASPFLLGLLLAAGGTYSSAYTLLALFDLLMGAIVLSTLSAPAPCRLEPPAGVEAKAGWHGVPIVASAMLFLFFYVGAELTFGGWVYTYAVTLQLANAVRAAYLTSIFWLAFTVGRLISIPAAVRVPPARILPAAFLGCATCLALLVAFPASTAMLWIAVAGCGLCMAPMWPSGFTLAAQSVGLTARISGVILIGDSVGGMVLPGLTGLVMERAGAGAMTQLVLASMGATFLAFLGILAFRGRRGDSLGAPAPAAPSQE